MAMMPGIIENFNFFYSSSDLTQIRKGSKETTTVVKNAFCNGNDFAIGPEQAPPIEEFEKKVKDSLEYYETVKKIIYRKELVDFLIYHVKYNPFQQRYFYKQIVNQ